MKQKEQAHLKIVADIWYFFITKTHFIRLMYQEVLIH